MNINLFNKSVENFGKKTKKKTTLILPQRGALSGLQRRGKLCQLSSKCFSVAFESSIGKAAKGKENESIRLPNAVSKNAGFYATMPQQPPGYGTP